MLDGDVLHERRGQAFGLQESLLVLGQGRLEMDADELGKVGQGIGGAVGGIEDDLPAGPVLPVAGDFPDPLDQHRAERVAEQEQVPVVGLVVDREGLQALVQILRGVADLWPHGAATVEVTSPGRVSGAGPARVTSELPGESPWRQRVRPVTKSTPATRLAKAMSSL